MALADPTLRFSSRVENYIRYRPRYPVQVLETLNEICGLAPPAAVADIASGTGIFSQMLLDNGCDVFGVEPNREMREAAERLLAGYSNFASINGTAEETTLPAGSVDLVTAAQAAHWFDLPRARCEFARILKPHGWAVLLWNERDTDSTAFLRDYEQLLIAYGTDYQQVRHEHTTANIGGFYSPVTFQERVFAMRQEFNHADLEGRLLSSSYAPLKGHANYESMLNELRRIFDDYQKDGRVAMDYRTRVYCGRLT